MFAYQGVINVSFSESFANILSEWSHTTNLFHFEYLQFQVPIWNLPISFLLKRTKQPSPKCQLKISISRPILKTDFSDFITIPLKTKRICGNTQGEPILSPNH